MDPKNTIDFAQRISVIGSTGSGKTYLARELSDRLGLPHFELDTLRRDTLQTATENSGFAEAVGEMVDTESWIIDGHYREVRQLIWSHCDLVVHLHYSPLVIGRRLLARFLGKRSTERPAADNRSGRPATQAGHSPAENASWKRRVSRIGKTIRERKEYIRIFQGPDYPGLTVIVLKSPRETALWLDRIEPMARPQTTGSANSRSQGSR